MIAYNFLLYLMNDPFTLSIYMERGKKSWGHFINEKRINQDMYERHWRQCNHLYNGFFPDHYFDNWNAELGFPSETKEVLPLKKIFLEWLPKLADELFLLDGVHIVVKKCKWEYWMLFSKMFSPLVIKVAYLWRIRTNIHDICLFIKENFEYTALPEYEGMNGLEYCLSDDHLHFNSGTEVDRKWVEIMDNPNALIKYARTTNLFSNFQGHSIIKGLDDMSELALEASVFLEKISNTLQKKLKEVCFDTLLAKQAWLLYNYWLFMNSLRDKGSFFELHKYLLIQGAFRELFVMQYHQIGLMQFNKVLHQPFVGPQGNDTIAEKLFRQVTTTIYQKVCLIEFRIGANQLSCIDEYRKGINRVGSKVKVNFICSLIKNKCNSEASLKRHLDDVGKALKDIRLYTDKIVGIDVAGRDFYAPPATFKKVFFDIRKLKKNKKWHFTYHAGEDFYHVLSGLRTIYEAILFLDLKPYDRIGHASAAGVNPTNWEKCVHGTVPIKQGEYLDDLLFAYKLIKDRNITELNCHITKLEKKIEKLSNDIFGKSPEINEWLQGKENRHISLKYNKVIIINCFDIFNAEDLVVLQKTLLAFMADSGIIIETCPTSNICIGYDHSLNSYHLKTWLKWKYVQYLSIPDIVIGTDEVGVFPTNLPNEYACIHEMICGDKELKDLEDRIMKDLSANSIRYAF